MYDNHKEIQKKKHIFIPKLKQLHQYCKHSLYSKSIKAMKIIEIITTIGPQSNEQKQTL